MSIFERLSSPSVFVATAGGIGFLRPGPGTWASLATAALAFVLLQCCSAPSQIIFISAAAATLGIGLIFCTAAARNLGCKDPGQIVIDEVAGMFAALAVVPSGLCRTQTLACLGLAFVWFRIFDIGKPWPMRMLETLPGALGIMADDVAAGLLAGVLTTVVVG